MTRARILLADDHALVVAGLRKLLEPAYDIVGAVADGHALVHAAVALQPDLVLLDIAMPLLNGIEAAAQLRRLAPAVKLVFVTMHADPDYVRAALEVGASGYVLKNSAAPELVMAIQEALAGRRYVTPQARAGPAGSYAGDLTPRQRQVLQLVAEGRSAKEIAAVLNISTKTAEFHRASLKQRLGLRTTAELTKYALEKGLVGR